MKTPSKDCKSKKLNPSFPDNVTRFVLNFLIDVNHI